MPKAQGEPDRPRAPRAENATASWTLERLDARPTPSRSLHSESEPPLPSLSQAQSLSEDITALSRGEPARALQLAKRFVELVRRDRGAVLAVARRCRAHMFRRTGRYREALRDYHATLGDFDRLGMPLESARTAIGTVDALGHMGRVHEAQRLAARARRTFAAHGEESRAARLDVNVGLIAERSGKPRDALSAYRRAAAVFETLGADMDLAMARFNAANALVGLDRYEEALSLYRSSGETWRARGATTTLGRCQLAIGSVLVRLGRLNEALPHLEETEELAASLDDAELTATAALDLARAELLMGRLETIGPRLDVAAYGFQSVAMHADWAESLGLRGAWHLRQGRAQDALGDWRRAHDLYRGIGHRGGLAWTDAGCAAALSRLGRTGESRRRLHAALRILERQGPATAEMEARLLLADQEMARRPRFAKAALELVARRNRALRDPWIAYRLEIGRGRLARRVRTPRDADRAVEAAYTLSRRLQSLVPFESLRAEWLGRRNELFELALDPAGGRTPSDLFLWSERARAPRWTFESLAEHMPSTERDTEDRAAFERARDEIHWLDATERARRVGPTIPVPAVARTKALLAWRRKRARALTRLERHGRRLEVLAAREGRLGAYAEPDVAAIQAALAEDEALIEFLVGERDVLTFVVSRDVIELHRSTTALGEARESCERLRQLWDRYRLGAGFAHRHQDTLTATAAILLRRLRELLLDPISELVPSTARRLVVSSHGFLRAVPFHALGSERWEFRYAASGQSLTNAAPTVVNSRDAVLIVGVASDDAPGAEREARAVAREYPGATLLVGADATPQAVREHWPRATLIHVAAHGALQPTDARLSGLQLTGGTWSAHDIRVTETRADLVVLSSCQSGETALWGSDHQVGLLPALTERGVPSAVVSLWPADDEATGFLMSSFHHELASRRPVGSALQSARRVVRGVKPAPYYWAPFVLFGADRRGGTRT